MSSSDYAIRIKDLGKQYRIGVEQSGGMYKYKSLRDSLGNILRSPVQALRNAVLREPLNDSNSFWALKDVSFDVKRGEVVGIIGRNGAGKSTLLKILSRITRPTTGEIELHGRVGSLLEVGTGFHPELSGRENIYLNGAVLGMTQTEVKKRFDEIVAFSEIEKFLDTPVKQYSSGMYTRLAFAVAAHLEPEILVVDEVLAVGDVTFQEKCLGKMQDVAGQGRTVLFVSHNMAAVEALCSRAILLCGGRANSQLGLSEAVSHYLSPARADSRTESSNRDNHLLQSCSCDKAEYLGSDVKRFEVRIAPSQNTVVPVDIELEIVDPTRKPVMHLFSRFHGVLASPTRPCKVHFTLRSPWLLPGEYSVTVRAIHHRVYDLFEDACHFKVQEQFPYVGIKDRSELSGQHTIPDFECELIG